MIPDLLRRFTLDAYIAARYGEQSDGRLFENALTEISHLLGFAYVQGPGSLNLFGTPAASGLRHELDVAMADPGIIIMVEAKDLGNGIGKNDVMLFLQKTFDYYLGKLSEGRRDPTWRILVSATLVDPELSVFCIQQGLILVDPTCLPLPVLLRYVSHPKAEELFDDAQLSEAVRLFEPACWPIERIFVPHGNDLHLNTDRFLNSEADDTHWLATQMSSDILTDPQNANREDPLWIRGQALRRSGSKALSQLFSSRIAV